MLPKLITTLLFCVYAHTLSAQTIAVNQVGFYPSGPKKAIIKDGKPGNFYLIRLPHNDTVFSGKLQGPFVNKYSPHATYLADFSRVNTKGTYRLSANGDTSYAFSIRSSPHNAAAMAAMKGYYLQRASMPLGPTYAGKWQRKAGHPDNHVLIHPSAASPSRPAGTVISSTGGWYDAGDYNKYIVNSGITMGTLLSLYEDFPAYCNKINLNIPESRNQLPDLLDECLYNLRWMLTMQDPADGGVYHKLTNASFDGMVMPHEATKPRYVVQKGTAATLDFAAVTAQAARVYSPFNKKLADSCRTAAIKAWEWAQQHPNVLYKQDDMNKQYQPPVVTGAYGDNMMNDEVGWAAAELYVTTGDEQYRPFIKLLPAQYWPLPSWSQVQLLAYYTLSRKGKLKQEVNPGIIAFADKLLAGSDSTTYQTVMGKQAGDYVWGSSAVAANQGIALLQAYRITRKPIYLDAAISNLDYLMGRNATGYCFLTGFGAKRVMHPHHRVSVADKITGPVPGLLSGGPNPGMQDKCTTYTSKVPDEAFTDDDCSYASNEIAINWNAPLVYLLWAVEALAK
ncbi:glycoside hydrolase family 9 protein [uncultured Chitinophaga sp.]|uniref:glycoside hydrolase family 9 protein n=1 Tax=uncultured Chitinophaga sp. TaxID=339340 RepID=UPI0025D0942B|nr:glycoside hydrolase family 9 protein [uncultured Chitinophaga sp.]